MRQRAEEKGFVFPFLYDETQETATAYGAARTPEVFVFDADHRLVYHGAPDSDHRIRTAPSRTCARPSTRRSPEQHPPVQETPPVGCTIKWR